MPISVIVTLIIMLLCRGPKVFLYKSDLGLKDSPVEGQKLSPLNGIAMTMP